MMKHSAIWLILSSMDLMALFLHMVRPEPERRSQWKVSHILFHVTTEVKLGHMKQRNNRSMIPKCFRVTLMEPAELLLKYYTLQKYTCLGFLLIICSLGKDVLF